MISLSDMVSDHITSMKKFKSDVTVDDVIHNILSDIPNPEPIETPNGTMKLRGCFGGPCACTGMCMEHVPYTAFDDAKHKFFQTQYDSLINIVEEKIRG